MIKPVANAGIPHADNDPVKHQPAPYAVDDAQTKSSRDSIKQNKLVILTGNSTEGTSHIQQQNELDVLLNCTSDLLWSVNSEFKLVAANRAFLQAMENAVSLSFKPGDDLLIATAFPKPYLDFWTNCYKKALSGKSFHKEVYTPALQNRSESWSDIYFTPVYNNGIVTGVACHSKDITEKKVAEEKIRQHEVRLAEAQEVAKLGSWETDLKTLKVTWSPETYRIFEADPNTQEVSHSSFIQFVHPDDQDRVDSAFFQSLLSKDVHTIEHRIITKSGYVKIIEERWRVFHDEKGTPLRAVGTSQDITERKTAEGKIKETEIRYQSLIEQSTDAVCITDPSMRIIDINPRGCNMLGYSKEEFLKLTINDIFIREDLLANPFKIAELQSGKVISNERRFKRKDGSIVEVDINARILDDGKFVVFARDITERKKADKELQQAYQEKNLILESIADAFFAVDKQWKVTYWNNHAERILGIAKETILGKQLWEVFNNSTDTLSYRKYHEALETNQVMNFEDFYRKRKRWFSVTAYPSPGGLSVYFKDITRRKNAEAAITRANQEKTTILESIDDGFFAIDTNSLVTYWNRRAEVLLGEKRENVIGKNLHEMFVRPDSRIFYDNYQKAIREKSTVHFEAFSHRTNKWFAVSAFASDNGLSVHFKDVTERKEFEEKIKESEKRYRSLIEQATDSICILDKDLRFVEINPAGCDMFGYSREEVLQLSVYDILFLQDLQDNPIRLADLQSQKTVYNERRIKRKDGTALDVELNSKMLDDGRLMIFGRDITERKQAAEELKESNHRYNLVSQATNDMVWDWDLVTGKVYRNKEGWKKIFRTGDYDAEVGEIDDWNERVHPDDRAVVQEVVRQIQRSEKDFFEVECRMRRDDGTYAYVHDRGNIIRDTQGKALRLIGATQDITRRKEAELQVLKSELHFRSLVQNSSDLTGIINAKGYFLYSSQAVKKILGYESEFMIGKNAFSFVHPDDIQALKVHLSEQSANHIRAIEFRFKNAEGNWRWLESKVTDMSDNPEVQGFIFNARDVTERKIAEAEIEKLTFIARATTNAVIITDIEGEITWVNEAFTNITEYQFEEVIGRKPGDFLQGPETNLAVARYMRGKIKHVEPFECDILNYSKSGRKYWLRIQCQPQFDEAGNLKYFFAMETDISKEKQAEAILKSSEERYRYLFNNNPASIIIWDIETLDILEVNNTTLDTYGYSRNEMLSKKILDLRHPQFHEKIRLFAEKARQKHDFVSVNLRRHINKAGEEMYMNIASHRIQFKGREVILALGTNITEKVFLERELEKERQLKHQEITAAVISAQEQERRELGSELHDNINQILAGSRLYLGMATRELGVNHPYLQETENLINTAITEIRKLSHSLIPPSLHEYELLGAIDNIIKITEQTSGIKLNLYAIDFDEKQVPDKLKLSIYRIIQEQLNNILKHANASKVKITLEQASERIILSIKDNGVGFDNTKKHDGVGLMNIKTRASLFNGEVEVIASPGKGCELKVAFN